MKTCTSCRLEKSLTEFSFRTVRGRSYLKTACKACCNLDQTRRRDAKPKPQKPAKQNAPSTAIQVDPIDQDIILDGLSADLRRVVWESPVPLDMRQVRQLQLSYRKSAPQRLIAAITREYPDWRMA